jgi:MFS family permease
MSRPPSLGLLFGLRALRMGAYGLISVVLVLYLAERGLDPIQIGLVLTLTLLGDSALSLLLSIRADRWGRRRTMMAGAALMAAGGGLLAVSGDFTVLVLAATVGVISPTGSEVGPFLAVEQACLAQLVDDRDRTRVFAWYNVVGFSATGLGALAAGWTSEALQGAGWTPLATHQALLAAYAVAGVGLGLATLGLSPSVEPPRTEGPRPVLGLGRSRGTVARLSGLFAVDAFGGGFILQSWIAWWLHTRFNAGEADLGLLFLGTNLLSGISALVAVPLAKRIGLVATMVWTHLPSNLLLMLVPLMPNFALAATVLLLRHMLSQMDVPTRQSYVNAIIPPDERSAANGLTGVARQIAASLAPSVATALPAGGLAFVLAGGIKSAYDLALWVQFRHIRPPEETRPRAS